MTTVSLRNAGRRTDLLYVQLQSFFDLSRFQAATRRITYIIGRGIFSPLSEKAQSMSTETMVGASRYTFREKVVTVLPRDLF